MRRRLAALLVVFAATLTLVAASCGDDSDDGDADTASTTTAPSGADPATDEGGSSLPASTLKFTTEDGTITLQFEDVVCTSSDESSFTATGEVGGTTIETEAAGQQGNVTLRGSLEFLGTIEEVSIGDTGGLAASGTGSSPDPSAKATSFTITGQCG